MSQAEILFPYQKRWLRDKSRFKIALKARQIGFSFVMALEGLKLALESPVTNLFVSASERQSIELLDKVYWWTNTLKMAGNYDISLNEKKTECVLKGKQGQKGGRILSLPANARTIRGFSGNVFLDEFAFHQDAENIYKAIIPIITRKELLLRVVSTPAGDAGLFYRLWTGDNNFSKHRVDIHDAMKDGLEIDLAALQKAIPDAEIFAQEFLCQFLSSAGSYIPMDMILAAVSAECGRENPQTGEIYIGVDIARFRHLSVFYVLEKLGDVFYERECVVMQGSTFEAQKLQLQLLFGKYNPKRCCIDAGGLGMQLAEELEKEYSFCEGVTFTNAVKEDLAVTTKIAFEKRIIRISDNNDTKAAINNVKRFVTSSGKFRFDAEATSKGHADQFWALALALHGEKKNIPVATGGLDPDPRVNWYQAERQRYGFN